MKAQPIATLLVAALAGAAGAGTASASDRPAATDVRAPGAPTQAQTSPSPPLRLDAGQLLEFAHRASGHVPYSGRQVTVLSSRTETTATVTQEYHSAEGQLRIETVLPLRARGRVVVDTGRDRWQYEPRRHLVYRSPSACATAEPTVGQLLQQYRVTVAPRQEWIAGRRGWCVDLMPLQRGKARRRMWIDPMTGVVLRYERLSPSGRVTSDSRFSRIRLGEPPGSLFIRPGPAGVRVVTAHRSPAPLSLAAARARFGVLLPALLPAGYTFADAVLLPGKGRPVAHLRYRDGLTAVSLYVAARGDLPYDLHRGRAVRLRQGVGRLQLAQHFYVMSWRSPRADFALVGDIAPELLARMANGTALTAGATPPVPRPSFSRWLLELAMLFLSLSLLDATRRYCRRRSAAARRLLWTSPGG